MAVTHEALPQEKFIGNAYHCSGRYGIKDFGPSLTAERPRSRYPGTRFSGGKSCAGLEKTCGATHKLHCPQSRRQQLRYPHTHPEVSRPFTPHSPVGLVRS